MHLRVGEMHGLRTGGSLLTDYRHFKRTLEGMHECEVFDLFSEAIVDCVFVRLLFANLPDTLFNFTV